MLSHTCFCFSFQGFTMVGFNWTKFFTCLVIDEILLFLELVVYRAFGLENDLWWPLVAKLATLFSKVTIGAATLMLLLFVLFFTADGSTLKILLLLHLTWAIPKPDFGLGADKSKCLGPAPPRSSVFSGLISNLNWPFVTMRLMGEGEPAIVYAYSLALRRGESRIFSPISSSSLVFSDCLLRRSISL